MSSYTDNPYVGPRTFETKHRHLFFGRNREARDLLSLVIAERTALFFAQSGAGKSSLINAGLIPDLRREGFEVLPVGRVGGDLPPGIAVSNVYVYNLLLSLDNSELLGSDQIARNPSIFSDMPLVHFLNNLVCTRGEIKTHYYDDEFVYPDDYELRPRILIIDQFEEILTTHPAEWGKRADFFEQLSDAMEADDQLWVMFSVRDDHVAALRPYAHILPGGLRARYYMERMKYRAALEAVKRPVAIMRPFAEGVAERLVENLRRIRTRQLDGSLTSIKGQFVEPVQLQVVCFQLWESLKYHPEKTEITTEDINALAGSEGWGQFIDKALAQFYDQAIAEVAREVVPGQTEFDLRHWFGTQLITKTRTRNLLRQTEEGTQGLDNDVIKELQDRYLLRSEDRAGSRWYELVHDRFIEPILQSNDEWEKRHPLIRDARIWMEMDKPDTKLYQGRQLVASLQHPDAHIKLVREFLKAGLEAEEKRELAIKAEAQARAFVLFRIMAAIAIITLLVVLFLIWRGRESIFLQLGEVKTNLAQTRANLLVIQGQGIVKDHPLLGLRLGLEALETAPKSDQELNTRIKRSVQALMKDGRLMKFGDQVEMVHYYPRLSLTVFDYKGQPGEIYFLDDDKPITLPGEISTVELSPDESLFLISLEGNGSELRRADTGEIVLLAGEISGIQFSPKGNFFVVDFLDPDALDELRRIDTSQVVASFSGEVSSVEFSPDETFLVAVYEGEDVAKELRRTDTGQVVEVSGRIASVEFGSESTSPTSLVIDYADEGIPDELYFPDTGEFVRLAGEVGWAQFSPDAAYLVIDYADEGTADQLHRIAPGQVEILSGEVAWVQFSPEATYLVVNYAEENIPDQLYLTDQVVPLPREVFLVEFSPNDTFVQLTYDVDNNIFELRDTETGEVVLPAGEFSLVQFSPDSTFFIVKRVVKDTHKYTQSELHSVDSGRVKLLAGEFFSVVFSPDKTLFVINYNDAPSELYHTGSDQVEVLSGQVFELRFSPDDTLYVVNYRDAPDELRRTSTDQVNVLSGDVSKVKYSPDSAFFAVSYLDEDSELRLTKTGEIMQKLSGKVYDLSFSEDQAGTFFVAAYVDGKSELWQRQDIDLRLLAPLEPGEAAYHLGDDRLVAWYGDGRAYLLDLSWLVAMRETVVEDPEALLPDDLLKVACRPFAAGLFDETSLETYLGSTEPLSCQDSETVGPSK